MKKFLVLFAFICVFGKIQAQDLLPPFKLKKIETYELFYSGKGKFFSKDSVDYLMRRPFRIIKYNNSFEIISPKSKTTIAKISIPENKILDNYLIQDFDNDAMDELIFFSTGKKKLQFYLFDNGTLTEIYSLDIPKSNYNGDIFIIPAQIDNDNYLEIILVLATNMPLKGSIRGAIAIDLQTKKVIWKNLFADYISAYLTFNKNDKDYLALFSYARSFHFYRANGKFYILRNFSHKEELNRILRAKDFSSDTASYLKILEIKTGKEIYKKRIGGKGVKVVNFQGSIKGYVGVLKILHILIEDPLPDAIVGLRKEDFSLVTISEFLHNPINKVIAYGSNSIVQTSDSTFGVIYKDKFKIFKIKFPEFSKVFEFVQTRFGPVFIGSRMNKGLLFDIRQKVMTDAPFRTLYLDGSGDLFIQHTKFNSIFETNFYRLEKRHFFERLTAKSFLLFFVILMGLLLLLTGLWLTTLFVSFRKISIQNNQIKKATSKLLMSEKLSALGLMSGSIAHQINSPLGAIINGAKRLSRKIDDPNVQLILEAGERIKATVNKFLITSRNDDEEKRGVLFSEVFNNWYDLFSLDFRNQHVAIIKNIEDGDTCLNLTSNELNEIINNLMFNARDSVIKSNGSGKKIIEISARKKDNLFEIVIEDNGSGFDKKILRKGIKLFATTKGKGEGTGLGLWIISNILKSINGKITIGNTDKGAKVIVEVPVKEACDDNEQNS